MIASSSTPARRRTIAIVQGGSVPAGGAPDLRVVPFLRAFRRAVVFLATLPALGRASSALLRLFFAVFGLLLDLRMSKS
jgi:hypothetical protein